MQGEAADGPAAPASNETGHSGLERTLGIRSNSLRRVPSPLTIPPADSDAEDHEHVDFRPGVSPSKSTGKGRETIHYESCNSFVHDNEPSLARGVN